MKLHNPLPESLAITCEKAASILDHFVKGTNQLDAALIPSNIIERARGIAIITIVKAGVLWSGRAGTGLVVARLEDGSWSAPCAIAAGGVGVGAQIGCQITDVIFVLNNSAAVQAFAHGNCTLGGNISVAAGPTGRSSEAGGSVLNPAPIYSYSKSKGFFAGISFEGTIITPREKANKELYGRKVGGMEILSGKIPPPPHADPLYRMLNLRFANLGTRINQIDKDVSTSDGTLYPGSLDRYTKPKFDLFSKTNTLGFNKSKTPASVKPVVAAKPNKPRKAIALYDFTPQQDGDLAIREGQEVWVIKQDGEWLEGSCNGVKGVFPASYVQVQD
ncbi:hypothetical protein HDV06_000854 [Boothiomyces sp. JEL0866]|nr:hypothetical protein HDV06_000854 [Boothiomyces sp. JEL0866]